MADEQISISLSIEDKASGEIKKFTSNVQKAGEQAAEAFKKSNIAFDVFKANLGSAAVIGAIKTLGNALSNAFSGSIDAAAEQQQALQNLNTALALSGRFSEEASKDFQRLATEIQATTKYSDELILSQAAIASVFTKSNKQTQELVKAAVDLSAALGISLDQAVQTLGKSLSGQLGKELSKTIPALKGVGEEALKSGAAIDFVIQKFGGAAASQVNTFSGSIALAQNAFGELKEAIGNIIVQNPVIISFIKTAGEGFLILSDIINKNKQVIIDFISNGLLKMVDGFAAVTSVVGSLIEEIGSTFSDKFKGLTDSLLEPLATLRGNAQQAFNASAGGADVLTESLKKLNEQSTIQNTTLQENILLQTQQSEQAAARAIQLQAEIDAAKEIHTKESADLIAIKQNELATIADARAKDSVFQAKLQQKQLENDKRISAERLAVTKSSLSEGATLMQSTNKELFALGKASAIASGIINTYEGATKAIAQGGIFGPALAAIVITAGLANVAKIAAQKPAALATGIDSVPGTGNRDNFPAMLTPGERVVSAPQNRDLTNFLDQRGNDSAILERISAQLAQRQPVIVKIGEREIVNTLRDELRAGFTLESLA